MREWLVIHPCGREQVWVKGKPMQSFELIWPIRGTLFWAKTAGPYSLLDGTWHVGCPGRRETLAGSGSLYWGKPLRGWQHTQQQGNTFSLKWSSGGGASPFWLHLRIWSQELFIHLVEESRAYTQIPNTQKGKESEVAQSCPTLCDPMDCSLPGSSVHGIFQTIVLEWIAISFSRGASRPRDQTQVSHIVDRCFTVWATREVYKNLFITQITMMVWSLT